MIVGIFSSYYLRRLIFLVTCYVICISAFWCLLEIWSEPYDYFGRRGRKEPEALAAASLKRVYVENRPYLVGGFCQHDTVANINKNLMLDAESIVSMSEKYIYMRKTFRKRLAFGKQLLYIILYFVILSCFFGSWGHCHHNKCCSGKLYWCSLFIKYILKFC